MSQITLNLFISKEQEGSYFYLPFVMPAGVEKMDLTYQYERYLEEDNQNGFSARQEKTIIDLGLIDPRGNQVGASGSDKLEFVLSETFATPGYVPRRLEPGEWSILVGAYKVAPEGVSVTYQISFTEKHLRLFKGDLHVHTLASDGVCTVEELGWRAVRHGLDFLAITDHNQMASAIGFPEIPGLTLIPGVEWTHYQGHANFLGVDQPYDTPFATNSLEEAQNRFDSAKERGALITINHPFEEGCGFKLDYAALPFDCIEIWNGPMRESNLRAIGFWQSMLATGKKTPVCGGSDYHKDTPFIFMGGPTTCIISLSPSPNDLLNALRQGHAYITFAPNGPGLELSAGEQMMGDTVNWLDQREMFISADGLLSGDIIRVVTKDSNEIILKAPCSGKYKGSYPMQSPGFARVEILRAFLPGLPLLPALISNPIYFEDFSKIS